MVKLYPVWFRTSQGLSSPHIRVLVQEDRRVRKKERERL